MQKLLIKVMRASKMSYWYAGMQDAIFECRLSENGFLLLGENQQGKCIDFDDGLILNAAEHGAHPTGLNVMQKEEVRQMIQSALDTGSA